MPGAIHGVRCARQNWLRCKVLRYLGDGTLRNCRRSNHGALPASLRKMRVGCASGVQYGPGRRD